VVVSTLFRVRQCAAAAANWFQRDVVHAAGVRGFALRLACGLICFAPIMGWGQERPPAVASDKLKPSSPAAATTPTTPVLKPGKSSSKPPEFEEVLAAPDDSELLKRFVSERSRAAIGLLPQDPGGAERRLTELRTAVKTLQPRTSAGKRQLAESLAAIDAYGKRIELARTDLMQMRTALEAKPNQPDLIHRYFDKLSMEIYSLARTDAAAARKLLDDSQGFARELREKVTEQEAKRQYEQSSRRLVRLEAAVASSQRLAKLLGETAAPLQV